MKKLIFSFLLICTAGFSALPPLYQTSKEITTILKDERLQEKLGSGQLILDIIKSHKGWVVISSKYHLDIDVQYLPTPQRVGPMHFELYFHDPVEIKLY